MIIDADGHDVSLDQAVTETAEEFCKSYDRSKALLQREWTQEDETRFAKLRNRDEKNN